MLNPDNLSWLKNRIYKQSQRKSTLIAVSAQAVQYGSGLSPSKHAGAAKIAATLLANSGCQVAGSSSTVLDLAGRRGAKSLLGCLVSFHFWHSLNFPSKKYPRTGVKSGEVVYRPN